LGWDLRGAVSGFERLRVPVFFAVGRATTFVVLKAKGVAAGAAVAVFFLAGAFFFAGAEITKSL
jgi:hypothetical protein